MTEIADLVEKELSTDAGSKTLIDLWHEIHNWHEEGGPALVKDNLTSRFKYLESTISKSIKEITPEVKPKRKAKKHKRSK